VAEILTSSTRFWAVDKIILAYSAGSVAVILGWWSQLPYAAALLAVNVLGGALIVYQVKRPNLTTWIFRNWYWLPFIGSCYKEMALFIPVVRHTDADQWLAGLDYRIWHAHPTVWLERLYSPGFTEFLQVVYTLFIPALLLIACLLWWKGRYAEFQYYSFLIALGFLASYIGYLFVPARGPRFLLKHLQHIPLQGMWLFHGMQEALDRLESAHYDCFPSGHTELTMLAWWGSRMVSKRLFQVYLTYTPCIIFATVYLRYHYTVDVMAGALLAIALILLTPVFYKKLSQGVTIGRN
jgi:membrane-associated phospholipid phosphatase